MGQFWFYNAILLPKEADGMANSVDPDQTAVSSGSILFAETYLSEYFISLSSIYL